MKMNILYASDDNFAKVLGVSLYSLLISNSKDIENIFVISQNISKKNVNKLNNIASIFNKKITFLQMPNFESILGKNVDIKRYSLSMFSRIIISMILPKNIDRILYLDCDTLINNNLSDLYNYNLGDKIVGAVNDYRSFYYQKNLNITKDNCYINSGVLLIDVKKYNENNCQDKLLNYIKKYNGLLEFPDNDAICSVLQDDICLLPLKYNKLKTIKNFKKTIYY